MKSLRVMLQTAKPLAPVASPTAWKAAPVSAAQALLPIVVRSHVRLTEPDQYRGCRLVAMLNKFGQSVKAEHFRSIALFDASAKFFHRLHRGQLVEELQSTELPVFRGCVPGSGPTALTGSRWQTSIYPHVQTILPCPSRHQRHACWKCLRT